MRKKVKFFVNQVELVILKAIIRSWHHSWGYAMISFFGFILAAICAIAATWYFAGAIAAMFHNDTQLALEKIFVCLVLSLSGLISARMARQILPVDVRDAYVGGEDNEDNQ